MCGQKRHGARSSSESSTHLRWFLKPTCEAVFSQHYSAECCLSSPYRKVGQNMHPTEIMCQDFSFKPPHRCHLQYPKTKYLFLKVKMSSDGWIHLSPNKKYSSILSFSFYNWFRLDSSGYCWVLFVERFRGTEESHFFQETQCLWLSAKINSYIVNLKAQRHKSLTRVLTTSGNSQFY